MGMKGSGERMYDQDDINRGEAVRPTGNLKQGKVSGNDRITAEVLKYGGGTIAEQMHPIL